MKTRFMPVFFHFWRAIVAFASIDLFFFYAFHELALIPTFLLIGNLGSGNRVAAAWKITIYLAVGSFFLLLGLILLYQSFPLASRSFDIRVLQTAAEWARSLRTRNGMFICCCLSVSEILISLFPVSHVGAGSVCRRTGTRCDAARWGVEEIRTLWAITPGYPNAARRRPSLGDSARRAVTRQHHLRRTGYYRAEAARLDARVLERDAHGLTFSSASPALVFLV